MNESKHVNVIAITPPQAFFGTAYQGLSVLKQCHWHAGGNSILSTSKGQIKLELLGAAYVIAKTMTRGTRIFTLNIAWNSKGWGSERKVPRV